MIKNIASIPMRRSSTTTSSEGGSSNNYLNRYGAFQMIGPFATDSNNYKTDLVDVLVQLKKEPQLLFNQIKRTHTYELGICEFDPGEEVTSNTQGSKYKMFSQRVSALRKADLLIRIPATFVKTLGLDPNKYNYLLNPAFIRCRQYENAKRIWNTLVEQENVNKAKRLAKRQAKDK